MFNEICKCCLQQQGLTISSGRVAHTVLFLPCFAFLFPLLFVYCHPKSKGSYQLVEITVAKEKDFPFMLPSPSPVKDSSIFYCVLRGDKHYTVGNRWFSKHGMLGSLYFSEENHPSLLRLLSPLPSLLTLDPLFASP